MSLRTALLRQRLPTASPSRIISIRAVSSTPRRRAGHDDGHGGGHAPEEVEPDVYHQSCECLSSFAFSLHYPVPLEYIYGPQVRLLRDYHTQLSPPCHPSRCLYNSPSPVLAFISTIPLNIPNILVCSTVSLFQRPLEEHPPVRSLTLATAFPSPFYRNSLLLLTLLTLSSPYWPSTPKTPTSPTLTPDAFNSLRSDPSAPWLTRVIARFTTDGSVWNDRNDRHLALVMDAAEQRLLFQEAEKPKVWRIRNTKWVGYFFLLLARMLR